MVGKISFYLMVCFLFFFFFQAEDGIRDLVRSRGLGDVYKRQRLGGTRDTTSHSMPARNASNLEILEFIILRRLASETKATAGKNLILMQG